MITQWNDDEDGALQGLPHLAQLLYLRCLRRFMDYETGFVGVKRKVSYQMFRETLYVEPMPGRNIKDKDVTVQVLRTAVSQLERVGLVESRSTDRQLIFFLPMAARDQSGPNRNNRGTTEEQQTSNNTPDSPPNMGFQGMSNRGTTDQRVARNNNPPGSGIRIEREGDRAHEDSDPGLAAEMRRCGEVATMMRSAGVKITAMQANLCEWVRAGITDNEAREAIDRAREYKPAPQEIPAKYLAPIVAAVLSERDGRRQKPPATSHGAPGASSTSTKRGNGNYDQRSEKRQNRATYESLILGGLVGEAQVPRGDHLDPDGSDLPGAVDAIDGEFSRVGCGHG